MPPKITIKKEKRSQNFIEEERSFILDEVKKHSKLLESKKGDSDTNKKKNVKWEEITEAVNAQNFACVRTVEQVKGQWKRMKEKAKSSNDDFKKKSKETGGGPPPPDIDDRDKDVLDIVGDANDPVDNLFDDDMFENGAPPQEYLDTEDGNELPTLDNASTKSDPQPSTSLDPDFEGTPKGGIRKRLVPKETKLNRDMVMENFASEYDLKVKLLRMKLKFKMIKSKMELNLLLETYEQRGISVPADISRDIASFYEEFE